MRKTTDYIIIHCSATRPSQDIGFEEINRWHRAKGWLSCGYHRIIRQNGTVEQGRQDDEVGAANDRQAPARARRAGAGRGPADGGVRGQSASRSGRGRQGG